METASSRDLGPRPDRHQSHRSIAGATDAVRMGVRGQADYNPDATAFHGMPVTAAQPGKAIACKALARKSRSRRGATGAADALRLEVGYESHRHGDAQALRSLPETP